MTFKEIGNEPTEEWKPTEAGDSITGIYAKKKTKVGPNKSNLYIFEIEGKLRSVWGSKVLDDRMDNIHIEIGDTLRITYEGKNEKPEYHKFKVEKDFPNNEMPDAVEDAAEEAEEESKED